MWNTTSTKGGNIQKAADFAIQQPLNTTDGDGPIWECYPSVAAVAANYGDPNGTYAAFLANADNTYPAEPYFLFNQPLSDSGLASAVPTKSGPSSSSSAGKSYLGMFGCSLLASCLAVVFSFVV
jgi:hypothetical protein